MRFITLLALLTSCGSSSTGPHLGDNIDVRFGASTTIPGDTTSVRFSDVVGDSRCPTGAQCVWAGEATVVFTVGGGERVTLRLTPASPGTITGGGAAIVRGTVMTFVDLRPHPALSSSIARADYMATIRFDSAKD